MVLFFVVEMFGGWIIGRIWRDFLVDYLWFRGWIMERSESVNFGRL